MLVAGFATIGVYVVTRPKPPVIRPYPFAGVAQVDVSKSGHRQAETAMAVDPTHPNVLVAGAGDTFFGLSAYSSIDGGMHWSGVDSTALIDTAACVDGDPAVAVSPEGRQYIAFLAETPCGSRPRVYVATRASGRSRWQPARRAVAPLRRGTSDDKPAIAIDSSPISPHRGRVYIAWATNTVGTTKTRGFDLGAITIVHSDDGGQTWSARAQVSPATQLAFSATVAVAPNGRVFVAWDDPGNQGIWIDEAADGIHFGADKLVAPYLPLAVERCDVYGNSIPAQPRRCVGPNPVLSLDARPHRPFRAYVTYSNIELNDSQGIFLVAFDRRLRPVLGDPSGDGGIRVGPADGRKPSDQFWPASAFDPATGLLWVCYYDTRGDDTRRTASYACAATPNGRRWIGPKRVASVASDESRPPAARFEFGDYEGLAVARGVAHPIWTDSRELPTQLEEIFTTSLTGAQLR